MTKDDAFDLIVKAFGVGFLAAAIASIPAAVEALATVYALGLHDSDGRMSESMSPLRSMQVVASLGAMAKFLVYMLASFHFLRSGSLVRWLAGRPAAQDAKAGGGPDEDVG
jgi:hypothetical protein